MQTPHTSTAYKLFAILSKKQKIFFLFLTIAILVATGLEIIAIWIMLPLMTAIIDSTSLNTNGFFTIINNIFHCETDRDFIFITVIILTFTYITKGIYKFILLFLKSKYLATMRKSLSINLFNIMVHLPYTYHLHNSTSFIQNAIITDTERTTSAVGSTIDFVSEIIIGIGLLIFLIIVDFYMAFFMIIFFSCIFLLNKFYLAKKIYFAGFLYKINMTNMLHSIHQAIGGIKFIFATQRQRYIVTNYSVHADTAGRCTERFNFYAGIPSILSENIIMAGICIIMAVLVMHNENFKLMLPIAAAFALAATRLLPVCNRVMGAWAAITYKRASVDTIYNLIYKYGQEHISFETDHRKSRLTTQQQSPLIDGVAVDGISFRFTDGTVPIFQKLSLTIPANKITAFVGHTGSGKTTLSDIILSLHKPYEGTVLADGRDIFMEKAWWASKIGYIPQNIYLCDDSILANVAYGLEPKDIDVNQAWACLKDANLREFVESLPQGIDTIIGENGIRLSGGQRQRLGIARALYAKPVFLVMDEATSALDNETEDAVMETITRLSGKITLLIIAHRLSTIANSDRIYRIENGCAVLEKTCK